MKNHDIKPQIKKHNLLNYRINEIVIRITTNDENYNPIQCLVFSKHYSEENNYNHKHQDNQFLHLSQINKQFIA